jgi:hypothetical protein
MWRAREHQVLGMTEQDSNTWDSYSSCCLRFTSSTVWQVIPDVSEDCSALKISGTTGLTHHISGGLNLEQDILIHMMMVSYRHKAISWLWCINGLSISRTCHNRSRKTHGREVQRKVIRLRLRCCTCIYCNWVHLTFNICFTLMNMYDCMTWHNNTRFYSNAAFSSPLSCWFPNCWKMSQSLICSIYSK